MNPLTTPPSNTTSADEDLAEQARPGHGIPSKAPDPAAQITLEPQEAEREANSVLIGGGVVVGATLGAVAGALGAVAGALGGAAGVLGGAAGVLGGAAAGATANPEDSRNADRAPADTTVRLHIDDSGGGGRPVVLIHGWPLSAQAWEPQVSALRAASYGVVAYDRRGFGRSDKPESGYSYDALADNPEAPPKPEKAPQMT